MSKEIVLTRGKVTVVDDADYDWLMQWKWQAQKKSRKRGNTWYAVRTTPKESGKRKRIHMHREIAAVNGITQVDHRDGDGLNNQRSNLRPATNTQNIRNMIKIPGCSSQFKGVYWNKPAGKWVAQIRISQKRLHLGCFDDETEAAQAYDAAALEHFGEFCHVNFPL